MRIMKKAKFDKELVQVLCPYGEWKHSRGMQVVDFESARRMKRSMLILRALGGIPIYIGHPDDYPDGEKVPVGKIVGIFSTHDGIAVVARYSDSVCGRILKKEISAMSPRWQMEKLPDGKYRPVRLLSVGLTNNPNIPLSGTIISAVPDGKNISKLVGCAAGTVHTGHAGSAADQRSPDPARLQPQPGHRERAAGHRRFTAAAGSGTAGF